MKKIIGILGGMGPGATADAFEKLVARTPAGKDQEHIPVIVASLPDIPDRTENIIHSGVSPLPAMLNSLNILKNAGASCIIMPCNTAHYWYDELKKHSGIPFISIIESTCDRIISEDKQPVAILATTATIRTRLYQNKLAKSAVTYLLPDEKDQDKIMKSILLYKSGNSELAYKTLLPCLVKLEDSGAKYFIMGCTEIPLILHNLSRKQPDKYIDTTEELIKKAIRWYYS